MLNPICKSIWTFSLLSFMATYISVGGEYYITAYAFGYIFFGMISRLFYDLLCYRDEMYDYAYLTFTISIYCIYNNILFINDLG